MGLGMEWGLGREMGCVREMADELWEGHTLLKTGVLTDTQTETRTDRQTHKSENSISASFTPFNWRI